MGKLVDGDDGLPVEEVGFWAKDKHDFLCRYIDASRKAREKWIGKAGATYIDLFCGPGRCRVRGTEELIDGGAVAAWKKSRDGGAPFSKVYIADLDDERRNAATIRLRQHGAPVIPIAGSAVTAVQAIIPRLNPYGLHFVFLDPFNLETLDFRIFKALSALKYIDILVHLDQMDHQRNAVRNAVSEDSAFDSLAPGWRDKINIACGQLEMRQAVFQYWRDQIANLGVWPSTEMRLIRGSKNQPLYWLLLAAKHPLPHKLWSAASNIEGQGKLAL